MNLKDISPYLGALLAGFVGGILGFSLFCWLKPVELSPPDAIAIANTYIVYTTLIFVGFSVLLAIGGYIFTQMFSMQKSEQFHLLMTEIKQKLRTDESFGIEFIDDVLKNPNVVRHVENKLASKIDTLLDRAADSELKTAASSREKAEFFKKVRQNILKGSDTKEEHDD